MSEILVEITPQAVAQVRRWLLLLASADAAPAWDPAEDYPTPRLLQATARWLVANGHGDGMDIDLVAVLLALFSIDLRCKHDGAGDVALIDVERLERECRLGSRRESGHG